MKIKIILLLTICLAILTINIFGQVKAVTKAEYDELDTFEKKTSESSRIVTTTTKEYKAKTLVKTRKVVQEYESEKRKRWTYFETKDGVTKKTLEITYFDGREFRRENEGDWKEIDRSSRREGVITRIGQELPKMEQYAMGNSVIDGNPVRLFSFYRIYDFGKVLNFQDKLIWVGEDGRIVGERQIQSNMFPSNITETSETKYQYDPPNLKIDIPDIPKADK